MSPRDGAGRPAKKGGKRPYRKPYKRRGPDPEAEPLEGRELADPDDEWRVGDGQFLRRTSAPEPLGEVVEGVVGQILGGQQWRDRLRGATIFTRWDDLVGPQLAKVTEPVRLYGGRLVIRAENQAWATQVRYLANQLKMEADRVLGPRSVQHVEVVVGPLEGTIAEALGRTDGDA